MNKNSIVATLAEIDRLRSKLVEASFACNKDGKLDSPSPLRAAVKRASLDVTRALAKLRKEYS